MGILVRRPPGRSAANRIMIFGHPERIHWSTDLPELYKDSAYIPLFTEIGYALGKAYWGHGYATEAARAVLEYAFRDLRVRRFEIPGTKATQSTFVQRVP